MHQKYSISGEFDDFASVVAQIEYLVNTVASEEMGTREHDDVEAWIANESDEHLRRLLQAHLVRRAEKK